MVASHDLAADLYAVNLEVTERFGMQQYEVSNFARAGEECRHNLQYWRVGDYVGVGPGAAGRITTTHSSSSSSTSSSVALSSSLPSCQNVRESFMQIKLPDKWMREVETQSDGLGAQERLVLTPSERMQVLGCAYLRLCVCFRLCLYSCVRACECLSVS